MHLLSAWDIAPGPLEPEIQSDPALAAAAAKLLPERAVLCHTASSQPKKEWPLRHWAAFYEMAVADGRRLAFTTATGAREQSLMDEFKKLIPSALILPPVPELALFLALLKRAEIFISGDTGPLHFAAGLGVPTLSLFGPSPPARWAPIGQRHRFLMGSSCACDGNEAVCQSANHCLAAISPGQVLAALQQIMNI
jgi:ADP-heptose:LPS heptosyltransferase